MLKTQDTLMWMDGETLKMHESSKYLSDRDVVDLLDEGSVKLPVYCYSWTVPAWYIYQDHQYGFQTISLAEIPKPMMALVLIYKE